MALNFSAFKRQIDDEEEKRGSKPATLDFSALQRPKFLEKEESSLLGNVARGIGGAVKGFVGKQADNIKSLATGETKLRDVLNEVPDATKRVVGGTAKFGFEAVKEIIQAPLRFSTSASLSVAEATTGKKQTFNFQSETAKAFFGSDRIATFQQLSEEGSEIVEQLGGKRTQQDTLPLGVILAGGLLDFTGFGGSKNVVTRLGKEGSEEVVEQILKKEAKGLTDDMAKRIAPTIAKETDEKAIQQTIEKAFRDQARTPKPRSLKIPDTDLADDFARSIDEVPPKDDFVSLRTRELLDDPALKSATKEIGERRAKAKILAEQEFDLLEQGVRRVKNITDDLETTIKNQTKKFDDVEDFIQKKGLDPDSVLPVRSKNLIVEATSNKEAVLVDMPVSRFGKPRFETLNQTKESFEAGRKITDPIEATYQNGKITITDGANRFTQAVTNGDQSIPVVLEVFRDGKAVEGKALDDFISSGKLTEALSQAPKKRSATPKSGQSSPSKNVQKNVDAVSAFDEKKVKADTSSIVSNMKKENPILNTPPTSFLGKKAQALKNTEPMLKFQETMQDSWIRVKRIMEKEGVRFTDDSNPYQEQQLFHGIVGAMEEDLERRIRGIDTTIRKTVKNVKADEPQFRADINDFLYARHAIERNKALGDGASGITDRVARETLSRIDNSPASKQIKEVAEEIQKINNETLDILLDGQVIDKEMYDKLRKLYPNHVPLNRVLPEDSNEGMVQVLGTKGFNVTSIAPIKRAKGSDLPVKDIQANIVANYKQALERAEKNKVNLATYRFAKENNFMGGMFEEATPKLRPVATEQFEKVVDPKLRNGLAKFAEDIGLAIEDKRRVSGGVGKKAFGRFIKDDKEFKVQTRFSAPESTLAHEIGHAIDLGDEFKGVFKGITKHDDELRKIALSRASKENIDADPSFKSYLLSREEKVAEAVSMFVTAPSKMDEIAPNTKKFLEKQFASNPKLKKILDIKPSREKEILEFEDTIFRPDPMSLQNQLDVLTFYENGKKKFLRIKDVNMAKAFQDLNRTQLDAFTRSVAVITRFYSGLATRFNPEFAVSNIVRDTQDLFVNMLGITGKNRNAGRSVARVPKSAKDVLDWVRGKDTKGSKLYQQMREDGGTTGGLSFTTREGIDKEIDDIIKNGGKISNKTWRKLVKGIENYNRVFEDATRLSAYKEALEAGYTRKQSAVIAKNSTVNFNTKGTATPWINAFYMFANASVQGSIRTIRSMKNPKVLATVTGTMGAGIYWSHNHNDSIDPEWRDKVRKYDREHSFLILLPTEKTMNGELQYISIPVSWGLKPIKVLMERSYEMSQGIDSGNLIADTTRSLFEAYNPIGGTDFFSTLTPTPLDLPAEVVRNKAWHGGLIFPDWKEGLPASEQIFKSTEESLSGKSAIQVSELLEQVNIDVSPEVLEYGFQQLVGGAGRSTQRVIDTSAGVITGNVGDLNASDLVYVNRFFKELKSDEVERRLEDQSEDKLFDGLKEVKDPVERKDLVRDYIRDLETDEAQSILFQLRDKGFETKGISYSENPRKPSVKDATFDDWYAYYRSRKFNYTREEAREMAEGWVGTVEQATGSSGSDKEAKLKAIFGDLSGEPPETEEEKQQALKSIFDFSNQ